MTATCRTLAEIEAAGYEAGLAMPPLTQQEADRVAAILAPHLPALSETQAA